MTEEDAKKNSTDGRIYDMQREYLLSLKKGIAFQKAFMASVERLKYKKSPEKVEALY